MFMSENLNVGSFSFLNEYFQMQNFPMRTSILRDVIDITITQYLWIPIDENESSKYKKFNLGQVKYIQVGLDTPRFA